MSAIPWREVVGVVQGVYAELPSLRSDAREMEALETERRTLRVYNIYSGSREYDSSLETLLPHANNLHIS